MRTLPMTDDSMQQIARRETKGYEFQYEIATRTRILGDEPLPEDRLRNHEYNTRHQDWDRFSYAYCVRSIASVGSRKAYA